MLSRSAAVAVAAAPLLAGLLLAVEGPAAADGEQPGPPAADPLSPPQASETVEQDLPCASVQDATDARAVATGDSAPLLRMRVDEVHRRYATGAGVGVAVIDSGVAEGTPYLTDVARGPQPGGEGELTVEHGTMVAGLIAGRRDGDEAEAGMGVAPDARIHSIRVVGSPQPDGAETIGLGGDQIDVESVYEGLEWVADRAGDLDIRVLNMSLTTEPTPELVDLVAEVRDAGVLVVAATGNRDPEADPPPDGENEVRDPDPARYPAAIPGVLGVTAYVPPDYGPASDVVLASTAADVAAPTLDGITTVSNGSSCVLDAIATSWASAYVSGVAALLFEAYDGETPEQVAARIEETASGQRGSKSLYGGAGLVQPLEAMERTLTPTRRGRLDEAGPTDPAEAAPAPPAPADALADSRRDFRWWGLLAGSALVAAVVLRPLLRRARRSA